MLKGGNDFELIIWIMFTFMRITIKEIKGMEMDVIPPGTHVNTYESYDIMLKIKETADILLPLHEPKFASVREIP